MSHTLGQIIFKALFQYAPEMSLSRKMLALNIKNFYVTCAYKQLYLNNSSFAKQTTLFCCRLGVDFGSGDKKQKENMEK